MKTKFQKTFLLVLASIFLLSGIAGAYTVKETKRLSKSAVQRMLPDKIMAIDLSVFSTASGNLLFPVRDGKSRRLEWVLVNPFTGKVVKSGKCPFRVYTEMSISPDGKQIFAFSRYPTALWHLNLQSDSGWKMLYENPKQDGLAILSVSPLTFVTNQNALSIFDMWDSKHFTVDTFITMLSAEPFKMDKLVSMKDIRQNLAKNLQKQFPKEITKGNYAFQFDPLRFGDEGSLATVADIKIKKKGKIQDYKDVLVTLDYPDKLKIVDTSDGRIFPLDYQSSPNKLLYRVYDGEKVTVHYYDGKTKKKVLEAKALSGRIMNNNTLGVAAVQGRRFLIYVGSPQGEQLEKMLTLTKPYKVGFADSGTKLVLISNDEIICYTISK